MLFYYNFVLILYLFTYWIEFSFLSSCGRASVVLRLVYYSDLGSSSNWYFRSTIFISKTSESRVSLKRFFINFSISFFLCSSISFCSSFLQRKRDTNECPTTFWAKKKLAIQRILAFYLKAVVVLCRPCQNFLIDFVQFWNFAPFANAVDSNSVENVEFDWVILSMFSVNFIQKFNDSERIFRLNNRCYWIQHIFIHKSWRIKAMAIWLVSVLLSRIHEVCISFIFSRIGAFSSRIWISSLLNRIWKPPKFPFCDQISRTLALLRSLVFMPNFVCSTLID